MAEKRKSWIDRRDKAKAPHVTVIDRNFAGTAAGSKLLISSPQEIDTFIRQIPQGTYVEPARMRAALAQKHQADATCPVSTGIFLRIVAEAALEDHALGKPAQEITPFWRVIDQNSVLARKLSADSQQIAIIKALAGD